MNYMYSTAESRKKKASYGLRWAATGLFALLLLASCGPKGANQLPEQEEPDPTTAGTIAVAIRGLTPGAAADISVKGPGSFSADMTASGKIEGLEPGAYTVTAAPVPGHNLVGAAVQSVEVKAGEEADVTVTYTTLPVGSLTIEVNGLTAGTPAAIEVTGGAVAEFITETTTLANMPIGTYSVVVGPITGHVLTGDSSFDVEVEDGEETAVTVTYAAADLSVTTSITNPQLPLQTELDLQFDIARSGAFTGDVAYEVSGADGFLVEAWSGGVTAGADSFTITLTDDEAELGTYELRVTVSGSVYGQSLEHTLDVALDLVAVVTDDSDDVPSPARGSLRALVHDSRTDNATITFSEDLLAPDLHIALAGHLELVKDVSIAGPSGWTASPGPAVSLSGNDAFTPIVIGNAAEVTLANVQVRNGRAVHGGGIQLAQGSSLTLDGVYVFDNVATGVAGQANPPTGFGGGISSQGILNVRNNSRIFQNEAAHYGAGIWTDHIGAVATLENSVVSFNSAGIRGGGLYLGQGTLTLRGTAVRLNNAVINGGGVMAANNSFQFERAWLNILDGSEIIANTAPNGAGIYSYAEATIADSTIRLNAASASGGGIRNHLRMSISNTEISENSAAMDYGGLFNDGIMLISDSHILANTAEGHGGGIYNGVERFDVLNSEPKRLVIERSQLSGNVAGFNGGAGNGGGIHNIGELELIDSGVADNEAVSGNGGGIYSVSISHPDATAQNSGELSIRGSTIANNTAESRGGGIYTDSQYAAGSTTAPHTALTILNSTVSGNTGSSGGGIYMWGLNDGSVSISFSTIADNRSTAAAGGGGIVNNRSDAVLRGNIIALNTSTPDTDDRDINSSTNMSSDGYNIVTSAPHFNVGLNGTTDRTLVNVASLGLHLLANNGGGSHTHAIGTASVAAANVPLSACVAPGGTTLTTDQRGMPRPGSTGLCSSGSFEIQSSD